MNPTEGTILSDRYSLTERIASGGMGEVWAATDTVLGRTVAVKLLHPALSQQSGFVERFRAEARHTAALHHPNITTVFDYGEDDGTAFLVMELVAGQPLSQIITERAPLSAQETSSILIQAATALAAAHKGGVVHRDVKPANILITPDGTAKLTDFGIARLVDAAPLTQTGQVLGTAQYLSPEQAMGQGATASSDIYALGVIGHEMLTGQRPFDTGTMVATALAHINQPPPPLPDSVPVGVRDVISAALAKNPADRPASAAAMAHALAMPDAAFASGAPAAPEPTVVMPAAMGAAGMGAAGMGAQGVPAQGTGGQIMPTQAMPAVPPAIPERRSRRGPAWLLAAAAAAVLGLITFFLVSDPNVGGGIGGNTETPVVPATSSSTPTPTPTLTPTLTPTPTAPAVIAPTAVPPTDPDRPNRGRGNGNGKDDDEKDGQ